MQKDKITVEKSIDLEIWLLRNCFIDMFDYELFNLLITSGFSHNEIEYLIRAYYMPFKDILKQLEVYDNSHPRMDELKFISSLKVQYNTDTNTIIKRIRDVRAIDKFLNKNSNVFFTEVLTSKSKIRD